MLRFPVKKSTNKKKLHQQHHNLTNDKEDANSHNNYSNAVSLTMTITLDKNI